MFPDAPIVHCHRDARDTCLSNYFQYFPAGIDYAHDLADIVHFYLEYRRLMAHWAETLGVPPVDVRYEDLIADPEAESRRIIDALGLPWEPACLEFYRTRRDVRTVSAWQVRRPVYSSSIGRWRHYERHVASVFEALGPQ